MKHAAIMLMSLALAAPAFAQTTSFQKQAPEASQHAVTPAEMDKRLEEQAADTKRIAPKAARVALVDFAWPESAAEYRALGKFIVVLVVATSQREDELPLKQLMCRQAAAPLHCRKLRRAPHQPRVPEVATVLRRFREGSFYLAPAGDDARRPVVDFAVNRTGFRVYEFGRAAGFVPTQSQSARAPKPIRRCVP